MNQADDMELQSIVLNRTGAVPLFVQLRNVIREKISTGEWAVNEMIPSENKLSEMFGVSRMTVRNVITQFVSQGQLYRIQGKGTFVSDTKIEISSLQYSGIRKQLEEQGHSVDTILVSCIKMPADEYVADKLSIRTGEPVYDIRRIRSTNGLNLSYHQSFVPVALCPDLESKDLKNEQLCKIMSSDYLFVRGRAVEILESFTAGPAEAACLNVRIGFPLILLQDQLYTQDNTIYEYSRVYFRGDKIKIKIVYNS